MQDQISRQMLEVQTSLGSLQIAPGGNYAAWVVTNPSAEQDKYLYYIHAAELGEKRNFPLTAGGSESSFCWLNDKTVVYASLRAEADKKLVNDGEPLTVLYTIDINGGESKVLARIPVASATVLAARGSNIFLSALYDNSLPDYVTLDDDGKKDYRKKIIEKKQFAAGDERSYRFDGMGYINKMRRRLYVYDISTKELKSITKPDVNVRELSFNYDKSLLVFCTEVVHKDFSQTHGIHLYNFNEPDSPVKTVTPDSGYNITKITVFKEKIYFWGHEYPKNRGKLMMEMLSVSMDGAQIEKMPLTDYVAGTNYTSDATRLSGTVVKPTADALYFIQYYWGESCIYKFDGALPFKPVHGKDTKVNFFDIYENRIICGGFDKLGMQEVLDITSGSPVRITDYNARLGYTISPPVDMAFTNSDGVKIDGWLIKPHNVTPGKKYPAVLLIHGGPHSTYSDILMHDAQYMAAKGYAVMYCNPRGSIGRGPAFAQLTGKYGTIDYQDVMEFVDHVLKECGDIDDSKLVVTGASYGGFMTNWIITHTNRFAAAVSQCSVSNWHTMYYISDIPAFVIDEMGGTAEEIPAEYHRAAPISYVSKVKTPTLFLNYDMDFRCPIDQGLQMYNGLLSNGIEARIVIFSGDSHTMTSTGKPSSRIRRQEEMIAWFDKFTKN